jgi:Caspase domain
VNNLCKKKCLLNVIIIFSYFSIEGCATVGAKLAQREVIQMAATGCEQSSAIGKVTYDQCELITRVINLWGINEGMAGFDARGRIELRGSYQTEEDVDKAFVVAQTIVGPNWVSPVTPRNIKVLKWRPIEDIKLSKAGVNGNGAKRALLIGVSKFAENGINPIKTARNDVESIGRSLQQHGFEKPIILVDQDATRSNIIKQIDYIAKTSSDKDTLFVYISTHGAPPDKYGQLNIVPYDFSKSGLDIAGFDASAQHTDKEYLSIAKSRYDVQTKYGVPADSLNAAIHGSRAQSVVGILDLCYSGAALGNIFSPVGSPLLQKIDSSNPVGVGGDQVKKALGNSGTKDLVMDVAGRGQSFPMVSNIDLKSYERMVNPYNTNRKPSKTGLAIITASSGDEKSYFDNSDSFSRTGIRESYFTHFFVKGLEISEGDAGRAFDYAGPRTSRIVMETSGNSQHPTYTTDPDRINLDIY